MLTSPKDLLFRSLLSDKESKIFYRDNPEVGRSRFDYCPTCRKRGTYRYNGVEHDCNCEEQVLLQKLYLLAGIGELYQRLDWDHYEGDPEVVKTLQDYVQRHEDYIERGLGLLFTGKRGIGKTMLATLVLKEFIRAGYSCYFSTYSSAMEMHTAGRRGRDEKRRFEEKFLNTRVLLLDDIGREAKSIYKMQESTFEHILRNRVQFCRPTILTTSLSYDDLEEGFGASTVSLLSEQSRVMDMTGDNFRPRSNTRKFDEVAKGERRPIF